MNTISFITISYLVLLTNISYSQTDKNSAYDRSEYQECIDQYAGLEIFTVVATPPLITSHDYEALISSVEQTVRKMRLSKKHKSVLTLTLIFPTEGEICINDIEINGDHLSDKEVGELIFELKSINEYESGKQDKEKVICLSIFDVIIKKGKLHDIQYDNVQFK